MVGRNVKSGMSSSLGKRPDNKVGCTANAVSRHRTVSSDSSGVHRTRRVERVILVDGDSLHFSHGTLKFLIRREWILTEWFRKRALQHQCIQSLAGLYLIGRMQT